MTKYDTTADLKKLKELIITLNEDDIKKVSAFVKKLKLESENKKV